MILDKMSELQQRLILSGIGVLGLLIMIACSHIEMFKPIFALFAAGVISLALYEYYTIAKANGCHPLVKIGIIGSVAYVLASFARTQWLGAELLPLIVLWLIFISAFTYYFIKGTDPFINLAITLFGIIYLTIPLSCLIDINYFSSSVVVDGRWGLIYLLFVTKMTDTAAFFVGKLWGKRQLSPYISPKKTWEGAAGGLVGAIITSILFYVIFHLFFATAPLALSLLQSLWLGALISVTAQFGDLAESLLKRDVGVKDSSHLPGLGGVLDIVDSLIFTSPLMYLFLKMQS
ncbi:MAG: CDP-archaeol synthase [Parachlamydiaceae bacterium]|nr:CDP-archaeol synthase [Parachlamydiaceae bacterium]